MKWSRLYLLSTIPGVLLPWWFLTRFLVEENASIPLFFSAIFVNAVSSAVAADLLVSALIFTLFVYVEGKRTAMQWLWLFPLATFAIGLSFGLPLFLYCRERTLEMGRGVNT